MFTSFGQPRSAVNLPQFETRKALVVINVQNDSLDTSGDLIVCQPQDFVGNIKALIPFFRRMGDIVWVRTEFETVQPVTPSAVDDAIQRRQMDDSDEKQPSDSAFEDEMEDHDEGQSSKPLPTLYFPTSRNKAAMRRASARTRAEQRKDQIDVFNDDDDIDDYLQKPRKGQPPEFYVPGTYGAALADDILPCVDETRDLMVIKNHYSALDSTPLLLSLRMKLVTHILLCGCLSNVSIYATAADAVRHGFEVTVVEDCLGYRSEAKHLDAMRQMADLLGVSGIDSEEIIEESGGRIPPDADVRMFSGPGFDGILSEPMDLRSHDTVSTAESDSIRQEDSLLPNLSFNALSMGNTGEAAAASASTLEDEVMKEGLDVHSTPDRPVSQSAASLPNSTPLRESRDRRTRKLTLGPGDILGNGDSNMLYNALSSALSKHAFELIKTEVEWQTMRHRSGEVPRLVAVQGQIHEDKSMPIYRHPADESPSLSSFSTTVRKIRDEVQQLLQQPFNHALIQLYRDGQDNISEHSDKTLDIARGSNIVNVSLGAQRVMTLRTKKTTSKTPGIQPNVRQSQHIPMPHNSAFILGPNTNRKWLHGIRPDKRRAADRAEEEKAFDGERISITFRQINTFIDHESNKIWGQGARSKSQETAGTISTNNSLEMDSMIHAFGKENKQVDFNWDAEYGIGFDVVNLVSSTTQLTLCSCEIANLRVKLSLLERGVPCEIKMGPTTDWTGPIQTDTPRNIFCLSGSENPVFRDIDEGCSEITGDLAILFYLGKFYPILPSAKVTERQLHRLTSQVFSRVTKANEILYLWQELRRSGMTASTRTTHALRRTSSEQVDPPDGTQLAEFEAELEVWEEYAEETEYIGGDFYAIVDCAFWPVLNDIVQKWEGWSENKYPDLAAYHGKIANKESVRKALGWSDQ